jgi:phosphoadenosine phosphosulfate reductase
MAETALRKVDRLDLRPRFTPQDAIRLNNMFRGTSTEEMLRAVINDQLAGDLAVVSSFGAESAALLHLVATVSPRVPVIFLETGKHFPETVAYRDLLVERLGLKNLRIVEPDAAVLAKKDENGLRWSWDPDGCCEIRKVEPLARALAPFDASITGRKAFQAATRQGLPRFELDGDRLKINPLATWTKADLDAYFVAHDLPQHPLIEQGYLSIGCAPCTSVVKPGEDPRSGRWRGWEKTECGIHSEVKDGDPEQPSF